MVQMIQQNKQFKLSAVHFTFRQLLVPQHNLSTYGRWAFSVAGPSAQNCLSDELREPLLTANSFRQLLKTRLFAEYQCIQRSRGIARYVLYKSTQLLRFITFQSHQMWKTTFRLKNVSLTVNDSQTQMKVLVKSIACTGLMSPKMHKVRISADCQFPVTVLQPVVSECLIRHAYSCKTDRVTELFVFLFVALIQGTFSKLPHVTHIVTRQIIFQFSQFCISQEIGQEDCL